MMWQSPTNIYTVAHELAEQYDAIGRSQETISQISTIESRPTGVWVGIDQYPHEEWECSNCGNIINADTQDELEEHMYCHKCGAEMLMPWADMEMEGEE